MTSFILFAALLVIAVVALLLPPLLRAPRPSGGADQREANLAIFRDQLAEIERERDNGSLAEADFEQANNELQRRLLEEVQPDARAQHETRPGRKTALALLLVLPLAAAGGYALLGNQAALDPLQRQARITPQQIEGMVNGLVEKLKENPDDSKGWLMLARSYKVLERFPEAAEAYGRAGALVDEDPELLADYAEVLSRSQGGKLQGKPTELVERALKIDPNAPQALLLAGAAASDRQQFALAADYWARLLPQFEPGSDEAKALAAAVERAREIAAQPASGKPADQATNASDGVVSGEVTLSGEVAGQARPDDVLFVFARAEEGPRMPLAATRARVGDLPLRFRFDDSMALAGGKKLSDFETVSIEARVAKAGKAQSSSGDLFGTLSGVKPGSQGLRLLIDQVQP
ncbi:MAG: Formate-dependent nitrite reductase complex subunit NrfG [Candidatus Accumulibacter appositus]|uniref:Formate-dependent nitrite reductase complex subunit NrfG n=1 Tax=Candidatus Accumulibacter appositus TaxID=1454003 RepID=A0A011N4Q3_9PROT|nr:c-type cytochrome biogenesis protein CcmI [Accumulibacter sp.]EXI77508.1 MAG: Formate-dependent nitrite reductase complex subunit NrfG [Candidatus Accumulibacter appositus]HRF05349.1 c-type cytochrome biogenesis protein CcmI [Accumulibacter sp.]